MNKKDFLNLSFAKQKKYIDFLISNNKNVPIYMLRLYIKSKYGNILRKVKNNNLLKLYKASNYSRNVLISEIKKINPSGLKGKRYFSKDDLLKLYNESLNIIEVSKKQEDIPLIDDEDIIPEDVIDEISKIKPQIPDDVIVDDEDIVQDKTTKEINIEKLKNYLPIDEFEPGFFDNVKLSFKNEYGTNRILGPISIKEYIPDIDTYYEVLYKKILIANSFLFRFLG